MIDFLIRPYLIDQLLNQDGENRLQNPSNLELPTDGECGLRFGGNRHVPEGERTENEDEKKAAPGHPGAAFGKEAV
jgi:hypothetical protein